MRESGVYSFEELVSDVDGSAAFRWSDDQAAYAAAHSGDQAEGPEMTWSVEDDDDDLELSITPRALAVLMRYARIGRHYTGCSNCARVTDVP